MTEQHLTEQAFADLPLAPSLRQGIEASGFRYCTPIQARALPLSLAGEDVAGQAQTGTGKSAAFLIALLQRLLTRPDDPQRRSNQPRALILAPTRELAIQIHKDATQLAAYTELRLALAYGGTDYQRQRQAIEAGVDLLIGTPGRLIDYFKQHVFDLRHIEALVLDEADRMFDLGFIKDIRFLLRRMPPPTARLNQLFSATLSLRVTELAYEHMNNPHQVAIEPSATTQGQIEESLYYPADDEKLALLVGLLRRETPERALVFVNTKGCAERVERLLVGNGYRAAVLSGDVPQRKRQQLLGRLNEGELQLLVATDVAARGLHIPDLSHVFNYDLPQDPEDYVHRIGRTGRAGQHGKAITFACERYAFALLDLEQYIGRKIPSLPVSAELLAQTLPPAPRERHDDSSPRHRGPPRGQGRPHRPR